MSAADNGSGAGYYERLRRSLRGGVGADVLPIGEALHPVALLAIGVLLLNDWVLKRRFTGSAVTGKLSDLAGLAAAPVVLTALIGLVLLAAAKLGARIDPRLTQRRLVLAVLATGVVFAAIKLDTRAAGWFTDARVSSLIARIWRACRCSRSRTGSAVTSYAASGARSCPTAQRPATCPRAPTTSS